MIRMCHAEEKLICRFNSDERGRRKATERAAKKNKLDAKHSTFDLKWSRKEFSLSRETISHPQHQPAPSSRVIKMFKAFNFKVLLLPPFVTFLSFIRW